MEKDVFLIYCHLGKTAGTTMHYILNNNFPSYLTLNSYKKFGNHRPFNEKALINLLNLTNGKIKGIGGHTVFPYFDYCNVLRERDLVPFMFTFLRDPIKRYISHLNHGIVKMNLNWDFDYFVNRADYHNVQTRSIAGIEDANKAIDIIENKFSFVGLTEHFDESLLIMKSLFPGPRDINIKYEKQNVINQIKKIYTQNNLSNTQLDKMKEVNSEDVKLYSFVKDIYYPRLIEMYSGDIGKDLYDFKLDNKDYSFGKFKVIWHKAKNQLSKIALQPLSLR